MARVRDVSNNVWLNVSSITDNVKLLNLNGEVTVSEIQQCIDINFGTDVNDVYYIHNGRRVSSTATIQNGIIHVVPRLSGGKGGFGSMLRAIGAQIEKTTNREACRDLSGRRLRDINEEKRLKNWIAQQAERERLAAEKREQKLKKLCFEPKHKFEDKEYERERSELTDKVSSAVEEGFKVAASTSGLKRKEAPSIATSTNKKKKKTCLWTDVDDFDSSCSDIDDDEDDCVAKCTEYPDSGNSISATKNPKVEEIKNTTVHSEEESSGSGCSESVKTSENSTGQNCDDNVQLPLSSVS